MYCGVRAELGGLPLDSRVLLVTPWLVGLAVSEEEEDLSEENRWTGKVHAYDEGAGGGEGRGREGRGGEARGGGRLRGGEWAAEVRGGGG